MCLRWLWWNEDAIIRESELHSSLRKYPQRHKWGHLSRWISKFSTFSVYYFVSHFAFIISALLQRQLNSNRTNPVVIAIVKTRAQSRRTWKWRKEKEIRNKFERFIARRVREEREGRKKGLVKPTNCIPHIYNYDYYYKTTSSTPPNYAHHCQHINNNSIVEQGNQRTT